MRGLILFLVVAMPAFAVHHSLTGAYEVSKEIAIEGSIDSFEFVNPHPFLIIKVDKVEKRGVKPESWKLELDNLSELKDVGMTARTFKSGDRVAVKGNPGHNGAKVLYVRLLDRAADNFRYEQPDTTPIIGKIPGKPVKPPNPSRP